MLFRSVSQSRYYTLSYTKLGFTEEEAKIKVSEFAVKALENRLTETQLEYWMIRTDGNVDLAKELLKKRQQTFSLEKCIEKHGKEIGYEKWKARQEKWFKNYRKKSYSFASQDLFWKIQEKMNFDAIDIAFATFNNGEKTKVVEHNLEYRLYLSNRVVLPDFIYFPTKKNN